MANNKLVTIHQATSQKGGSSVECLRRDLSPVLCYSNKQCQWDGILPLTNLHGCQRSESQFKGTSLCAGERIRASPTKRLWFLANMYKKFGWEKWVFKAATFPKYTIFSFLGCVYVCERACMCVWKRNTGDEQSSPPWMVVGIHILLDKISILL